MFLKYNSSILKRSVGRVLSHKISTNHLNPRRESKEVSIEVPWGKLAAKLWEPFNVQPIIALHGWYDNASSFDPLAQYLPKNISLLAVDLPGHGKSSWIPKGMMYSQTLFLQSIERVKHHFGMDKIGLIGHSIGAILSFHYTTTFPECVKLIVSFDTYKDMTLNESHHFKVLRSDWKRFFDYEKRSSPRCSADEALHEWSKLRSNSIDESSCRILMERGLVTNADNTFSCSHDPKVISARIRDGYTNDHLKIVAKQIRCPFMVCKGEVSYSKPSLYFESEENYHATMEVLKQSSRDFRYHVIANGGHYFHMDYPAVVSKLINPFISQYMKELS